MSFPGIRKACGLLAIAVVATLSALGIAEFLLRRFTPLPIRALLSEGSFVTMARGEILLSSHSRQRLLSRTGEFEHEVRINGDGFRDNRELPSAKPANERRAAFLGDSFTFGYGSDFTNTIPWLVEQGLNARGGTPRVRSMNFGFRSGNCPRPQYVFFQKDLPRYQPDDVFWMLFPGNDFEEMSYFRIVGRDEHGLPRRLETPLGSLVGFLKHLALWQTIRVPLKQWVIKSRAPSSAACSPGISRAAGGEHPYVAEVAEICAMARVMQETARSRGWTFRVVLIALPGMEEDHGHAIARAYRHLRRDLLTSGIPLIDLSKMLDGLGEEEIHECFYQGDGHFTPLGNRLASARILREIEPSRSGR